jgi:hypothetical protein
MRREVSPAVSAPRTDSPRAESTTEEKALPLTEIEAAIRSVRHGVVQIVIQDGVVVQIDRTDKIRLR